MPRGMNELPPCSQGYLSKQLWGNTWAQGVTVCHLGSEKRLKKTVLRNNKNTDKSPETLLMAGCHDNQQPLTGFSGG